ncbi:hypothetical protein MK489_08815 [Myxococcota bacterium]|nr:hypothetical protein [Myxococcota bacterium]
MKPIERGIGGWFQPRVMGVVLMASCLALCFWLADRDVPPNDEGALLTNAAKLLDGKIFYRDIDAYPLPGAAYGLALAMGVFGEQVAVARTLAALVFCGMVACLYVAALAVVEPRRAAWFGLSLLSLKAIAWPAFTAYIYADVALAATCLTVCCLLGRGSEPRLWRIGWAGLGVGVAVATKQSLGLYAGAVAVAILAWPGLVGRRDADGWRVRGRQLAVLGLGASVPMVPLLGYFAFQGLLDELVFSALVRPFTGYLPTSSIAFSAPLRWWELGDLSGLEGFPYHVSPLWVLLTRGDLPANAWTWSLAEVFSRTLYTVLPVIFLLAAVRGVRDWRTSPGAGEAAAAGAAVGTGLDPREWRARRNELALFAGAALLSAFPRADFYHVISVYALPWLLAFALGERNAPSLARRRTEAVGVSVLLLASLALLVQYDAQLRHTLRLERAELKVAPGVAWIGALTRGLREEVPEGEPIFVYGHEAYYYFLADRYFDWPFPQLYPGQIGEAGGRAIRDRLRDEPPRRVVRGIQSWPGLPPMARYAEVLDPYMRRNFVQDPRFFARHPPAVGRPPPASFAAVLVPRGRRE